MSLVLVVGLAGLSSGCGGDSDGSCTVKDNGNGTKTIICPDGTETILNAGSSTTGTSTDQDAETDEDAGNGNDIETFEDLGSNDDVDGDIGNGEDGPTKTLEGSFAIKNSSDLAWLQPYTDITGTLWIHADGLTLVELPNLQTVAGDLRVEHVHSLTSLSLPALTSVGGGLVNSRVPNNPTSLLVPKADLIRLLEKLAKHGCILIGDESFIDFTEDPEQLSLESEIERYPNLVIFKSMSKAYGICGLRIGYMLTANKTFAESVRQGVSIWNLNGLAEAFLRSAPEYREEFKVSCAQVRADRDLLFKELSTIEGLLAYKPDANYIFCRLPDHSPTGPEVTRQLFVEHNIYIKHCHGKTMADSDRYLRIASRTPEENRTLVAALGQIVQRRKHQILAQPN
jgi:hypothetical protein